MMGIDVALRLKGKVALVTGCGSSGPGWGNGKAMSVLFAREGAQVFGCDLVPNAAQETQGLAQGEGGDMTVAVCDVTDEAQVAALVEACVARYGRIDVLVNNVGIAALGGPVELPTADWQRVMAVNVTSMFFTCKYVIPHMLKAGGGSLIHIGSIAGIRDSGIVYAAYSASKAAVLGLSRSVAMQYAKQHIRSNVICPGLMDTPMISTGKSSLKQGYNVQSREEMLQKRHAQVPMGHMGQAWDTAHAALWLASDDARYVTATEMRVDGGICAKFS